jgi:hypothetical protein
VVYGCRGLNDLLQLVPASSDLSRFKVVASLDDLVARYSAATSAPGALPSCSDSLIGNSP